MKFEDEFLSLQDKKYKWKNCIGAEDLPELSTCPKCNTNHTLTFMMMKLILQKHCLDKQRVEEVIDKLKYLISGNSTTEVVNARILKKELGLE